MDIKSKFHREGYVIIKSLINEELINKTLNALAKFKKQKSYYYTQSTHTWVKSSRVTKEGYLIDSIQSPTKQFLCGELRKNIKNLISSEEISSTLSQLSDHKYFVNWQNMLFDNSTGTTDHADTWYLDTLPRGNMVAAWIALEDINKEAGRFFVCPGSHKMDIFQVNSNEINNHYEYAKLTLSNIKKKDIKRYAPSLKKGDVLFWHPYLIHGSYNQTNSKFSRKSITAHYHPIGFGRAEVAEEPAKISKYIKYMKKSKNPYIYFDNINPSDFEFTFISFTKFLIKKYILRRSLTSAEMGRSFIKNK